MIYLKNTSTPQMVFVPKNRETEGSLVFTLKNTTDLSVPVESKVVDLQSDLFVQFSIELPAEFATGEYEYLLKDDAGVVSTGLLMIEGVTEVNEYNKAVQYEQYQ